MLQEKVIDCKRLEEEIFGLVCELGRKVYREALEAYDNELHKSRDRAVYRDKGHRQSVLKTLMGEVEYSRHVYTFSDEDGSRGTVYLLDEAIGRTESGFISEALIERIGAAVCELPFRKAAAQISSMTGQTISHSAVWNVTQQLGERIDKAEDSSAAFARKNKGKGELEAKLLFEEQDGVWLNMQGKSRKKHGKSYEMKVAIAYDGTEKKGKNRYELTNKVACANFESVDKFVKRKEGVIAANYNVDEIEHRILNGDGANWIKRSVTDESVHYQLDPFHRNRAIFRAAPDEHSRKAMLKMLYNKQIDELLMYVDALANSMEDEKQEAVLRELHTYFSNNYNGLTGYNMRGLDLPNPPHGKEYRTCGAMESNIFGIIGNRMKGRRRCWSIDGGNNLARLLCLESTHKLRDTLSSMTSYVPEKYAEEITTILSSAKIQKSIGRGYEPPYAGTFPATSGYKFLRNFGRIN